MAVVMIHEGLHVLGWRSLGGALWSSVSWSLAWRGLGLVARLNAAVSMAAYRAAAALPAAILGLAILSVGLVSGIGLLVFCGMFFFQCLTDFALLFASRTVPAGSQVLSHPDRLRLIITPQA